MILNKSIVLRTNADLVFDFIFLDTNFDFIGKTIKIRIKSQKS